MTSVYEAGFITGKELGKVGTGSGGSRGLLQGSGSWRDRGTHFLKEDGRGKNVG